MKRLLFNFLLIVILSLNTFSIISQKPKSNFEIQVYGTPYYKLSNHFYENRMTLQSDYFKLDYSEKLNQEIGLNFKYKLKKWKFGLGASFNNFDYAHSFYFVDEDNFRSDDLGIHIERKLKLNTIGLAIITEREVAKTISLGIRLSINNIVKNELSTAPIDRLEINNTTFIIREKHFTSNTRLLLIPELFLIKKVFKGLDLIMGCKLKVYNEPFEDGKEFYKLEVDSRSRTVFSYKIDTYQAGFFFGASYTFQLPKLRNSKVELIKIKKLQ